MQVAELKKSLIEKIEKINSEEQLSFLSECIDNSIAEVEMDATENLTPAQVQRLKESVQQIRDGKFYTHEQVKQMSKEWLSK